MKKHFFKTTSLSLVALLFLSGCVGDEALPNNATQTGAATGAVAGAVIGYNSGNHAGRNAVIGALLGTALGSAIGSDVDSQNAEPENSGGWE
ncbi:MAG: hypothetical protein RLZZ428_843 [Pseudomonadota bacterium]